METSLFELACLLTVNTVMEGRAGDLNQSNDLSYLQ